MTGLPDMRPSIIIFDQHKKKVKETIAPNRGADLNAAVALLGGTYYIRVRDWNRLSSVVPFRLMVDKK